MNSMKDDKFADDWMRETVENGRLVRRQYTANPHEDTNAKLDNVAEFDSETEEGSRRWRQGFVMSDGHIDWGGWELV